MTKPEITPSLFADYLLWRFAPKVEKHDRLPRITAANLRPKPKSPVNNKDLWAQLHGKRK